MKQKFNVTGMTCTSCVAHVERAIKKLTGIIQVEVNLLSNSMLVEYDDQKLTIQAIIKAVEDAGYGASIVGENKEKKETKENPVEEEIKSMKKRLWISFIFLIPLMYIAMYSMIYRAIGIEAPSMITQLFHGTKNAGIFGFTQLLLLLPILYVNRKYFINGFKALGKGNPNMDSLIAIGSSAATLYGIYAIYKILFGLGHGQFDIVDEFRMDLYFESAGTILTLITLGKYFETKSKGKTNDAIKKLMNLTPQVATIEREGIEIEVPIEDVKVGDMVVVRPGQSIPVDGVIIEGSSYVDQAVITGESVPVEKNIGDTLIAATINKQGFLKFRAEKVGENTTLAQIIHLVEEASNSKAPIAKLADKVSGVFVPIVIGIAILAVIAWLMLGQGFEFALSIGISVLVISCPCALGLATPVAIMVGTGKSAEYGILIKSAEALENVHLTNCVVLDKTGTITEGKPEVTDIFVLDHNKEEEVLKQIASIEKPSEHPLSEAIVKKAEERNLELEEVTDFQSFSGNGIEAKIDSSKYYAGNYAFMEKNHISMVEEVKKYSTIYAEEGKTPIYFASEEKLLGVIAVADPIKKTSYAAIQALKEMKMDVVMLTGDNQKTANAIKDKLEIDQVLAEVLPQEKEKEIARLKKSGKRVIMVGDGINDAPALVSADVGIAIGAGTDIAIESADIVLMKSDLQDVVTAIELSKAVIRNIKMNLFWAFFYNAIGIPIAAGVFFSLNGLKLNPMIGALAMSFSSVCVVSNALRLRFFKPKGEEKEKEKRKMKKEIKIEGMHCSHCSGTVQKALSSLEGVSQVEVDLERKIATIQIEHDIESQKIKQAIEEEGFEVIQID